MEYGILATNFMLVWFLVGLATATVLYEVCKLERMEKEYYGNKQYSCEYESSNNNY